MAVLALGGTVAARTMMFAPGEVADGSAIKVAPAAPFSIDAAARNLSQAVQFKTVSNQDAAQNQTGEWDKLQGWMATTYPKAHAAMQKELLGHIISGDVLATLAQVVLDGVILLSLITTVVSVVLPVLVPVTVYSMTLLSTTGVGALLTLPLSTIGSYYMARQLVGDEPVALPPL